MGGDRCGFRPGWDLAQIHSFSQSLSGCAGGGGGGRPNAAAAIWRETGRTSKVSWRFRPPMPLFGSRRSALLITCTLGLLAGLTTAGADARAPAAAPPASTSPEVGEPLRASTAEQVALGNHLRAAGAIFYGAWWCPACFQQKNLFGKEAGNRLPYVECDPKTPPPPRPGEGRQRCLAAGIRAFPTWVMPGRPRLEGVQTISELAAWSGFRPGASPTKLQGSNR